MTNHEVFEAVVRAWLRRRDPSEPLTFNQIASLGLGVGNPRNAARVGQALNEYRQYFELPRPGGYKCRARWEAIRRDHPHLFPQPKPAAPSGLGPLAPEPAVEASGPLQGMLTALSAELAAVREQNEKRPIRAHAAKPVEISLTGCAYEATVEVPGDEELPIPEGVRVRLRWRGAHLMEGDLLAYDAPRAVVIFLVPQPIPAHLVNRDFELLPAVEDLIEAVRKRLQQVPLDSGFPGKLLRGGKPTERPECALPELGDLDDSQRGTVAACLRRDISFVWGPPGTGKTHTLARLITCLALSGEGPVVATSIANVAVDQLALQVVRALEGMGGPGKAILEQGRVLRFGHPRLPDVAAERRLFPHEERSKKLRMELEQAMRSLRNAAGAAPAERARIQARVNEIKQELRTLMKDLLGRARVILTTAIQVCMEDAFSELSFGTVVVDEASMMPIPHLVATAAIARERLIVAGDFRQLGPVALAKSHAAHEWLHSDAFALVGIQGDDPRHPALSMLTGQRRMHADICRLINERFYAGKLRTLTRADDLRGARAGPLPGRPPVLVSLDGDQECRVEATAGGSRYNVRSSEVVARIVHRLLQEPEVRRIGVIAPYRAQASRLRALIREMKLSTEDRERVRVGTVHAFQGAEFDVIVWDLVDTPHKAVGQLYREDAGDRLCNVAISRARAKLIIVGVPRTFWEAGGANTVGCLRRILRHDFSDGGGNVCTLDELDA